MLSHVDENGQANMVDVSLKEVTLRDASAEAYIKMSKQAFEQVLLNQNKKGDVLGVARIAGIQGAKKCADLIPLCHPLALSKVAVDFELDEAHSQIKVTSYCKLAGKTGVEMEALTAVSVATLTLFDMCKAADPLMEIHGMRVTQKAGGKHGSWQRD
ncbi:cyclic pyranopterin monophosphate synthase MoaC [Pseudoalteromonas carrageenovora]|jgi:cyclic pyranopterin phosphate synthase|uniref:Cyclic pyranopterin monophosphate synthase MoaC n=1 Tax=Pseudoalteromonas undina TaxID=43660 RepID=A0ACC6R1L1_9GAMM|nr:MULTISPECIES: cyclic pyranopterin monophosphate synthase MoaC [Pseudoalteromonas]EAW26299.1 molybdenum cofactor biosynthesis protein C [Alteromonadales bacterium TW-7]ATG58448.1 cyclic pyranopterin monophosphate synthase MoaC [Pseudoalteromonas marina]KTF10533.1 cyclic pyranopterin monophosphate synthase accessory protein [Pseudoalteromonas sp. H103]MCK8122247.1 cyclic pyranopterin monophosphate synthase MoaC [Pseudoalteromonas sp. 2CM32C]MDO6636521.1 cyclic pyranopterin monophosphate synth